jgi:hypothetical protein
VNTSDVADGTRVVVNDGETFTIDREDGLVRDGVTGTIPEGGLDLYGKKVLPPLEHPDAGQPFAQPESNDVPNIDTSELRETTAAPEARENIPNLIPQGEATDKGVTAVTPSGEAEEKGSSAIQKDIFGHDFIEGSGIGEQTPMFHEPVKVEPPKSERVGSAEASKPENTSELFTPKQEPAAAASAKQFRVMGTKSPTIYSRTPGGRWGVADHPYGVEFKSKDEAEQYIRDNLQPKPTTKLFGARNRRRGQLNLPAIAEGITAASKAVKNAATDLRDQLTIEPIPHLRRAGDEVADAATEHASAYIAVPHVVNDTLSKVFPEQYRDPDAMARTIDVLNKDNILGGYDQFKKTADEASAQIGTLKQRYKDLKAARRIAANASVRRSITLDLKKVHQTILLAARDGKTAQASADAIANTHDLAKLDAEVQGAPADVRANVDRWKHIVNPELDQLYNEVKRVDPSTQREGRGRHFDARINLLAKGEEGSWAKGDEGKVVQPPGAGANAHRNPDVRRDRFDRSAKFTGDYSTDAHEVLAAAYGPRLNEASKLRFYDALVDSGAAVEVSPGEDVPKELQGRPAKWMSVAVPETNPKTGETRRVQVGLVVRGDLVREIKNVLDTDQRLPTNPVFRAMTALQLAQVADATTHAKNLLSVVARAQGAKSAVTDVLRRIPILSSVEGLGRIGLVMHEVSQDSPKIRSEIAEMAKKGLIRADHPETGVGKLTGMGAFLKRFDNGSRVVMNRFFDHLVERGLAKDTELNRRNFVNQVGVYNRRLMGPVMKAARDYGLSPFIVAGRNFNQQGRRALFGTPGFEAASKSAALQARATQMLGTTLALAVLPMMVNSYTTGLPMGRSGTPLGAIDLGPKHDNEDGTHRVFDLLQLTGIRRGMRSIGLDAAIEGARQGKDLNTIVGDAIEQVGQSALHPWVGPGAGGVAATLTGRRLDMRGRMEARKIPEGGAKQYAENFRASLASQNPLLYSAVKHVFVKHGLDLPPEDGKGYAENLWDTFLKSPRSAVGVKDVRPGTNAAEDRAAKLVHDRFGDGGMTADTEAKLRVKRRLANAFRVGPDKGQAALEKAVSDGEISEKEAAVVVKKAGMSPLQWNVRQLAADDAADVYKLATPEQQQELKEQVRKKILNSTFPDQQQDEMLRGAGIELPPDLQFEREYHHLNRKASEAEKTMQDMEDSFRSAGAARKNGREQDALSLRQNAMAMRDRTRLAPQEAKRLDLLRDYFQTAKELEKQQKVGEITEEEKNRRLAPLRRQVEKQPRPVP